MSQSTHHDGIPASALLACPVVNRVGESLGVIDDLIIEPSRGVVAYVMLARETGDGGGRKFFAIPFGQLEIEGGLREATVDLDPTVLDNSPGADPALGRLDSRSV